jgi:hypothetical protein
VQTLLGLHRISLASGLPVGRTFAESHTYDVGVTRTAGYKDRAPRWARGLANVSTRAYALSTAPLRPHPDYLIIGGKRGGTTSLHNYLLRHPGVLGLFPQVRGKKSTDYFFASTNRGDAWYRSHFHTTPYRTLLHRRLGYRPLGGEASPYYIWDPRLAPLIKESMPDVKAILLLRDPVERAWSHYWERRANGLEPLSFMDALDAEDDRTAGELDRMLADPSYHSDAYDFYTYRQRGLYLGQIENWLASFSAEHLLILVSEDLYADPQTAFDQVCAFLGLPLQQLACEKQFNSSSKGGMDAAARDRLSTFFAGPNAELEAFLGRPLNWS